MGLGFKALLFHFPLFLFLLLFLNHSPTKADQDFNAQYNNGSSSSSSGGSSSSAGGRTRSLASNCNWFRGKWVYDPSYPLYDPYKCPFIEGEFDCKKKGRPDNMYQKYRWQPFSCSLPRSELMPPFFFPRDIDDLLVIHTM